MSEKIVFVADPGIDGAFATALALFDPGLELLGLAATAGNVPAEQATRNIQILIEQLDPPRWPRLGEAPAIEYDIDATRLHGPQGLGHGSFPCATLHRMPNSEKLVVDLVRQYPREVTVVCMGPATVVARALDLCPDLSAQVKRLVVLGGTLSEPGNAGPVNEFNFFCDPPAVRQVLQAHFSLTMIPLDVMRQVVLAPADLLALPDETKPGAFLKQIAPFGIAANSNLHGVEGFYLQDVLGVVAVALPGALRLKAMAVDIETRGELTRGMSVFDQRPSAAAHTNVDLAIEVNPRMVRDYIGRVLKARFDS